jgi:hypothetical protein
VALPVPGAATTTRSLNLFAPGTFLYQDPYMSSCTAAAAMMMLNTIDVRDVGGPGFTWTVNRTKNDPSDARDLLSVLAWARAHDTLASGTLGSDPHGWRNALNWFGWGSGREAAGRVYQDRAYATFSGAVKAAVRAIARYQMPVGMLGRAGRHAQVMHGYTVIGADPAVSNDFAVVAVFVSDPLRSAALVNRRLSLETLRSGSLRIRFRPYREVDSPRDDPYTGGWIRSSVLPSTAPSEWYGRWVVILPVRVGVPVSTPTPTPTPTATPAPTPMATPAAAPPAS